MDEKLERCAASWQLWRTMNREKYSDLSVRNYHLHMSTCPECKAWKEQFKPTEENEVRNE